MLMEIKDLIKQEGIFLDFIYQLMDIYIPMVEKMLVFIKIPAVTEKDGEKLLINVEMSENL